VRGALLNAMQIWREDRLVLFFIVIILKGQRSEVTLLGREGKFFPEHATKAYGVVVV
jgi:hypothetical protein